MKRNPKKSELATCYLWCIHVYVALIAGHEKSALGDTELSAYLKETRLLMIKKKEDKKYEFTNCFP